MRAILTVVVSIVALAGLTSASHPANDLDALMARVLSRRDDNWKKLQQYVLDEREAFDLRGPGGAPLYGFQRDYTWFPRDGVFVRSPLRVNGATLGEADRLKAEASWIRRERRRDQRRREREAADPDRDASAPSTATPNASVPSAASAAGPTPSVPSAASAASAPDPSAPSAGHLRHLRRHLRRGARRICGIGRRNLRYPWNRGLCPPPISSAFASSRAATRWSDGADGRAVGPAHRVHRRRSSARAARARTAASATVTRRSRTR